MTSDEQSQLHVVILQALRAKAEIGRPEDALLNDARLAGGFEISLPALQVELRHLSDVKKWIIPMAMDLGPKRWAITALGRRKLEEAGL